MAQNLGPVISLQSIGSERQALGIGQTTKPLPRLPRGWSRVCHETGLLLRSIGLGLVVTAFQGFFTKNFSEPEKAAIRQNRVTALLRALVHALPLGMALFEIVLNWKGHYVGADFDKQNYLQFVAKTHEIFMQASITTIILSFIRYQVSVGKGMPFGAMLGALQFLQVSYLWSVEFWSAIMSRNFQLKKKICFVGLILICVTIAATAGPSSANLLIARQGEWPIKSSYLAVNASFQDIWPDRLDDEKISSDCKTVRLSTASDEARCPLSVIYYFLETGPISVALGGYSGSLERLENENVGTNYISEILVADCFGDLASKGQVCSSFSQQGFLDGIMADARAQVSARNREFALDAYRYIDKNYYQPYTATSCLADTVQNSSDPAPLRFARISETPPEIKKDREIFSVPSLTKGQSTHDIPGNSSQFRVGWIDLPQEIFRTGVPGAIIVHPNSSNDLSYNITTCTLDAGWGSSILWGDSRDAATTRSRMSQLPAFWPEILNDDTDQYGYLSVSAPDFGNISNFLYPQRRISISKRYMEFLNPEFVLVDNSTINPVSMLFSHLSSQATERELAWTFGVLLVAALSTTGMEHDSKVFQDRIQASRACESCLVYEISNSVVGWEYTTRETTTKLAIAVMLTYCILVLAHIVYSAFSGVSSTAWDSVAELVALAMNSSSTEILQNTCAGIIGKKAYETRVRVLKTSEKHLELVFGEVEDPNADISELVMNEKYGRIAIGKEDENETLKMEGQGEIRKRNLGQA